MLQTMFSVPCSTQRQQGRARQNARNGRSERLSPHNAIRLLAKDCKEDWRWRDGLDGAKSRLIIRLAAEK